ncbi:MAG TPA: AarF/UbiB family protein [Myxococcota bacterium]|nr:AarF/UbiB family protein [Myxococcota bacterium]
MSISRPSALALPPETAPSLRGVERLRPTGLPQIALLAWAALAAGSDLAVAWAARRLRADRYAASAERRAMRTAVGALGLLKGPFAKLGQFGAIRVDLLPEEVTTALKALRDRVPPLPFERIRAVVEAELGRALESAFAEFEVQPLGAASIAQAHRALLPGGEPVVVKVQYPWLAASLETDLWIARGLFRWFGGRHSGADALFREFGDGLREELDFEREARAGAEIAANLAGDPSVLVPEVIASHSTRRVLTMRHHPAVGIGDRAGLERLGVAPRAVLELLARAYCAQVFGDGLFHADPHPGNLFVLDEPGAATHPRLLFVDFGLSRRLEPALRRELRLGILALLQRDLPAFLDGMERIGAIAPGHRDDVAQSVGTMFERIRSHGGLAAGGAQVISMKDEAVVLLRQTPGLRLPVDLLHYAKTLSYVFSLGAELDAEVDMMKLCLPPLLRFLAARD